MNSFILNRHIDCIILEGTTPIRLEIAFSDWKNKMLKAYPKSQITILNCDYGQREGYNFMCIIYKLD